MTTNQKVARSSRAGCTNSLNYLPPPTLVAVLALEEPKELVFLTLLGKGSEKLKGIRVPMGSIAGDIFISKKSRIIHAPLKESWLVIYAT